MCINLAIYNNIELISTASALQASARKGVSGGNPKRAAKILIAANRAHTVTTAHTPDARIITGLDSGGHKQPPRTLPGTDKDMSEQPISIAQDQEIQPTDALLLALHNTGHSTRTIAKFIPNISKSTVAKRLKHLNPRKTTEIYKELKTDILEEKCRKLLMQAGAANPKEQRDLAVAYGVYADKIEKLSGHDGGDKPMITINNYGNIAVDNSGAQPVDNLKASNIIDL